MIVDIDFDKSKYSDAENAAFEIFVSSHQTLHSDGLLSVRPMSENRDSFVTKLRNRKNWSKMIDKLHGGNCFNTVAKMYVKIYY